MTDSQNGPLVPARDSFVSRLDRLFLGPKPTDFGRFLTVTMFNGQHCAEPEARDSSRFMLAKHPGNPRGDAVFGKPAHLLTDNHVKQRGMHFKLTVVLDEPELAELVHEVV